MPPSGALIVHRLSQPRLVNREFRVDCGHDRFAGAADLRPRGQRRGLRALLARGLRARRLCSAAAARMAAGTAGVGRGIAGEAHDGRTKRCGCLH
jgi:hypothetical protein